MYCCCCRAGVCCWRCGDSGDVGLLNVRALRASVCSLSAKALECIYSASQMVGEYSPITLLYRLSLKPSAATSSPTQLSNARCLTAFCGGPHRLMCEAVKLDSLLCRRINGERKNLKLAQTLKVMKLPLRLPTLHFLQAAMALSGLRCLHNCK